MANSDKRTCLAQTMVKTPGAKPVNKFLSKFKPLLYEAITFYRNEILL